MSTNPEIKKFLAGSSWRLAKRRRHSTLTWGRSFLAIFILAMRAAATGFWCWRKSRQLRRLSWMAWKLKLRTSSSGKEMRCWVGSERWGLSKEKTAMG